MSGARKPVWDVLAGLSRENLLAADWEQDAAAALEALDESQPWYVRTMVGFGAWLASLFLISFVVGVSVVATDGGYVILGLIFMVAATVLRRRVDADFANQMTLATSLAGQALFVYGIADLGDFDDLEVPLLALIVLNVILVAVFPDRIHRFLSTVGIVTAVVGLAYLWELNGLVPVVGPVLAAALVAMNDNEAMFVVKGGDEVLRPVMAGTMISAFGCLLLSTVYLFPEIARQLSIYPRPWISTVMLGAVLLFVERRIWTRVFGSASGAPALIAYVLTVALIVAALPAPGLILALVVIALGTAQGSPGYTGAGLAFLALFTGAYFYGIEVSMLIKSASLIATGAVILVSRWCLLFLSRDGGRHVNA
jgi:hypothetical protein